jgi:hypothetical protein
MSRIPYAAQQLVSQVAAADPPARTTYYGDADGFGVCRTVEFANLSIPLADALAACEDDRVAQVMRLDEQHIQVTFVADSRADFAHPFAIEEALAVLCDDA